MKKLLIGALAVTGLVFAGCEDRRDARYEEPGVGGAGTYERDIPPPVEEEPADEGTGGGEFEGTRPMDERMDEPMDERMYEPMDDGTGGSGMMEDDSMMHDESDEMEDRNTESEGGVQPQ